MKNLPPLFTKTEPTLDTAQLARYAEGWLLSGDIDQHSRRTQDSRRDIVDKLLWFLKRNRCASCGTLELRQFLAYLTHGHEEPGGRWGNPRMIRPVRPRTVHTYHGHLRTLFRWIVSEGCLDASPMERIPVPTSRTDQIQPFTSEQVNALLAAARRGRQPKRDEAILFFLLDTGVRASELCALKIGDVDTSGRRATVLGKGNKHRSVNFQKTTAKALWQYLKQDEREPSDPLFASERGEPLTRSGLLQLIERLGKAAGVQAARCSPHTFRHTFAVEFLRAGGNVFTLQQMLGHTSLHMTNRYVALAQADIENQHRQYSPVERLRGKTR
jgi:integrase/recombinase XerD